METHRDTHQTETHSIPVPALPLSSPLETPEGRDDTTNPYGRWCPFCGADLSAIPDRHAPDDAIFAVAGRRLKVAIAVLFILVWLVASMYDWLNDPGSNLLPGWFSALGAVMLFYLLGFNPMGLLRRK